MIKDIIYIGASKDLSHPSDRRGYPEFKKRNSYLKNENNFSFKEKLKILFLCPSNIELIKKFIENSKNKSNKKYRLILIYTDFYHADNNKIISKIRNIYRNIMYRNNDDYIDLITNIIRRADKLVLGSSFQREAIISILGDEIRSKTFFIEDYIEKDFINKYKENNKNNLNIIWEGIGYGALLPLIQLLIVSYKSLKNNIKIKIFFLTDPYISLVGKIVFPTSFLFKFINLFNSKLIYKKWSKENLIKYSKLSQIAIITINSMEKRSYYKPANKPRLFSSLGLKYIFVPNIPDYKLFSKKYKNLTLFYSINDLFFKIKELFIKKQKFDNNFDIFNAKEHNIMVDKKWKNILYE
tara:strand:+ start:1580 stop:2638 length:1059 start_codon:yes stop_codon:yes gene_type:complete